MNRTLIATAVLLGATTVSLGAFAQTLTNAVPTTTNSVPTTTSGPTTPSGPTSNPAPEGTLGTLHRDIHQQERIQEGLQNGSITTRESAQLARDEARVSALQSQAMRNGRLSASEQAELTRLQDRTSRHIKQATNNGVDGNPMSASSQRAQTNVQRNINQQERIQSGVHDGTLTAHEAARMEHGQARSSAHEYMVGRDGRIGESQAATMKRQDNHMSSRIYTQRRDEQHRH
jgi:hypothetical protein